MGESRTPLIQWTPVELTDDMYGVTAMMDYVDHLNEALHEYRCGDNPFFSKPWQLVEVKKSLREELKARLAPFIRHREG
jgi:hypothetical protein